MNPPTLRDLGPVPSPMHSVSDRLARRDNLSFQDIRDLKEERNKLPPRDVKDIAADLAARVKRAPQFRRFIKVEELSMWNLYMLQHKILSMKPDSMRVFQGLDMKSRAMKEMRAWRNHDKNSGAPLGSTTSPITATLEGGAAINSITPAAPLDSSIHKPPLITSTTGPPSTDVPDGLQLLLKQYHESLKAFKEMQTWREASNTSCRIARSDLAFHFCDENYLESEEKMFDLSPTLKLETGGSVDCIRRMLMNYLPLRYVNEDAWNEKRGQLDPGAVPERAQTFSSWRTDFDTPPFVDNLARVLVSLLAGLFLLVPMIVVSFIISQKVRLSVTVALVVRFAVSLGWFGKSTNDALMGTSAAYAAVLVVFVGQTSPIT
ncbi:uncharacterized protein LY89DRAFT_721671 [Mollisia scopiformis]|uniref:DUF6594 domain-containing protein n=1 Tax=Mollisia scopiformis TaxID=149040 RepID=A0A194WYZ2_MOLSC|nr:uncharacterized protein LY89DRAFT_721671 [Mollisia scopiformis]KUJ12812.1 hypothetical protein LY89DRAFT_721671 [Mollisia scopiformis]